MDNFFRTVEKRHSVRSFTEKPVEKTKTQKILMVARISPSAKGLQSYRIFIIEDKKKKEELVKACHNQGYVHASLILVFCTDPKRIKKEMGTKGECLFAVQDATIAASYAQLAAAALGLSSVWIGNFSEKQVAKIIRTKLRPIVVLPIGYEKKSTKRHIRPKKRKFQDMIKKV